jgi:hypothetical protein
MIPEWLSIGLMMAGWGVGFRLGYWALDSYLAARSARRAASMRNVTP